MAKQNDSTAIVKDDRAAALELFGSGEFSGSDGLSSAVGSGELKGTTPMRRINVKEDPDGNDVGIDKWYDTSTGNTVDSFLGVILYLKITREWTTYDESTEKAMVHCRSLDLITGTMADKTERPCQGCPDAAWMEGDDGKRKTRCSRVYNLAVMDAETQEQFMMPLRRTAEPPIRKYLAREHIGKLSGRKDIPLFAYVVQFGAEKVTKNYAIPTFERVGTVTLQEAQLYHQLSKEMGEAMMEFLRTSVSEQDAPEKSQNSDVSTSDYVDASAEDVTEVG